MDSSGLGSSNDRIAFGAGSLLIVPSGPPCDAGLVYIHGRTRKQQFITLAQSNCLIATPYRAHARFASERAHGLIDEGDLCCILAFVDTAVKSAIASMVSGEIVYCREVPDSALGSPEQLGHWLTLLVLQGVTDHPLLAHLRRQESYALSAYLLKKPCDGTHLNELCVEYGLSYSHFRRLCRRSLGHAIKTRMRGWRAARTVLDIIDSKRPILDIAMGNGYTSASHVSSDLKKIFGFTPRTARNARRLLP